MSKKRSENNIEPTAEKRRKISDDDGHEGTCFLKNINK
jgi:hypothetical protein